MRSGKAQCTVTLDHRILDYLSAKPYVSNSVLPNKRHILVLVRTC